MFNPFPLAQDGRVVAAAAVVADCCNKKDRGKQKREAEFIANVREDRKDGRGRLRHRFSPRVKQLELRAPVKAGSWCDLVTKLAHS